MSLGGQARSVSLQDNRQLVYHEASHTPQQNNEGIRLDICSQDALGNILTFFLDGHVIKH